MKKLMNTLATGLFVAVLASTATIGGTIATSGTVHAAGNDRAAVVKARQERRRAAAGRKDQAAQRKNTRDVYKAARAYEKLTSSNDPKKQARGRAIEKRIEERYKQRLTRQEQRARRNGGSFL